MKTIKLKFLVPLLALMLAVGTTSAFADPVKNESVNSEKIQYQDSAISELPAAFKLEQKEAYKVDDAEYIGAVASKSTLSGISGFAFLGVAMLGLFALFKNLSKRISSFLTRENIFGLAILALAVATYFISSDTDATSHYVKADVGIIAAGALPIANQLKALKEEKSTKVKEMNALVSTSEAEKRDFKPEELTKYENLKSEVEGINARIGRLEETHKRQLEDAGKGGFHISPIADTKEVSETEERDLSKYSFIKVLRSQCPNVFDEKLAGLELEMHQEAKNEARTAHGKEITGIGVPVMILRRWNRNPEKRDMTAGTTTEGGFFRQTDVSSDIVMPLRNRLVTAQAGAQFLTGLVGQVDIPTNGGVSAAWASTENATATESTPTIGRRQLLAKRLAGTSDLSVQLLRQVSWDVESMVRNDYMLAMAVALDLAAINGSGSSGQPTGILGTAGIGSVAGGTNGLAPTLAHIAQLEEEVAIDNADLGTLSYITNPKVRRKLKTTTVDTGSGVFVWDQRDLNNPLNGYRALITNNVPSNLTKGTSNGVCSAILFGNFNDLIIGMWGGMDVMSNPYTKAKEGLVEVIGNMYADVAVRRPESFAAMLDALTT